MGIAAQQFLTSEKLRFAYSSLISIITFSTFVWRDIFNHCERLQLRYFYLFPSFIITDPSLFEPIPPALVKPPSPVLFFARALPASPTVVFLRSPSTSIHDGRVSCFLSIRRRLAALSRQSICGIRREEKIRALTDSFLLH